MITYSVDTDRRVRTYVYSGTVTDAEMREVYTRVLADPTYDATLDDLVDMRPIERLDVSTAALREIVTMFSPVDQLGVPTRLAIVAPSDFTYGISRMYELLRGDGVPEEIRVFRSYDEAEAWLQDRKH